VTTAHVNASIRANSTQSRRDTSLAFGGVCGQRGGDDRPPHAPRVRIVTCQRRSSCRGLRAAATRLASGRSPRGRARDRSRGRGQRRRLRRRRTGRSGSGAARLRPARGRGRPPEQTAITDACRVASAHRPGNGQTRQLIRRQCRTRRLPRTSEGWSDRGMVTTTVGGQGRRPHRRGARPATRELRRRQRSHC
jgi:hypothetical protein